MHSDLQRLLAESLGELDQVPESLADLVGAFDRAYSSLAQRCAALDSAHREGGDEIARLEELLKDRTAQLQRANAALQRQVSDRRGAERELRQAKLGYRTLADHSPTAIFHSDAEGRTLYVNQQWCEITGLSAEQALGDGWQQALHPDEREPNVAGWHRAVSEGTAIKTGESRIQRPDGTVVWVAGRAVALRDANGEINGYLGTMIDITEQRAADAALRASEEKYRQLFESSRDAIYISTSQGRLLDINPAGVALFGYGSREEMLELDLASQLYVRPEDRAALVEALSKQGFIRDLEIRTKRKDGTRLTLLATSSAERNADGRLVAIRGILRDVTGQREMENRLRQAQKMQAVGRLAGGVAHDFNNLLTAILGYAELIGLSPGIDAKTREHAEGIRNAAKRGANLTRQLLALSRPQVVRTRVADLNSVLTDTEGLLRRVIGEDIELGVATRARPGWVRADAGQVEQIIFNLAINARDAMPGGGSLTLTTHTVDVRPRQATDELRPGTYVRLTASDTGIGIDPSIQARVFEPFFDTEHAGEGSVGLSTVYGIVRQNHGHVELHSERGKGSRFEIFLPAADEAPSPRADTVPGPLRAPATETILLVEDEAPVRAFLHELLTAYGYRVLAASRGREALEIVRQHHGPLDVLLSDIVMPGMSGYELARRLLADRPELKVLLMSGYADPVQRMAERGAAGAAPVLQKPFTAEVVARRLRELLDDDA